MGGKSSGGHVVVCGFGHVGSRIAERLCSQGHEVRVVESSVTDAVRRKAENYGCKLIEGDACEKAMLDAAEVADARAVLVVTGDDRVNLEAAIDARTMNPNASIVVRLFDGNLGRSVSSAFNVRALSSSALAAPAFVAAATDESIVSALNVDGCRLVFSTDCRAASDDTSLLVLRNPGGFITGTQAAEQLTGDCLHVSVETDDHHRRHHRLRRARKPVKGILEAINPARISRTIAAVWTGTSIITRNVFIGLVALGIVSVGVFSYAANMPPIDALYFVVTTMTTVGYGDYNLQHSPAYLKLFGVLVMLSGAGLLATVYAIVADHVLKARMEYLLGRRQMDLSGHTVVVGLGKVGYRVARELCAMDIPVVAIESRESGDNIEAAREIMPVIIGDASRGAIMRKSAIENAAAILALTDNPMLNLSIALEAKEANPEVKTVIRAWDMGAAEKYKSLGLDEVISASAIAAPAFVDAAMLPGVQGSFKWGTDDVLVTVGHIDEASPLVGKTAEGAGEELDAAVLFFATERSSDYRAISPDTVLQAGTKVIAVSLRSENEIQR